MAEQDSDRGFNTDGFEDDTRRRNYDDEERDLEV
jgi:hypothetical protein